MRPVLRRELVWLTAQPNAQAVLLFDMFYLDIIGLLVCVVAIVALALEGGYKHFADNLQVLSENNDNYQLMIDQQREQNSRLEKDLAQFSNSLHDMSDQNAELRSNVTELEETRARLNSSVEALRRGELELDFRNQEMKASIAELEASRSKLQQSVAEAAERNKELNASVEGLRKSELELAARNDESKFAARARMSTRVVPTYARLCHCNALSTFHSEAQRVRTRGEPCATTAFSCGGGRAERGLARHSRQITQCAKDSGAQLVVNVVDTAHFERPHRR